MKTFPSSVSHSGPFLAAMIVALSSTAAFADDAMVDHKDKSFLTEAYQGGLAEVKMGEMAQAKSANAEVKAFGAQMAVDHGKANAEIKTLADSKKVEVPMEVSMMVKAKSKLMDMKSGAEFDKAYAADMVEDHKKDLAAFEKAANEAKDAEVKAFAAKTLPVLKHHLSMAEEMQKKVGGK